MQVIQWLHWDKGLGYNEGMDEGRNRKVLSNAKQKFHAAAEALNKLAQLEEFGPNLSEERAYYRGFLQALFPREGGW